jgi:hypothetical protein
MSTYMPWLTHPQYFLPRSTAETLRQRLAVRSTPRYTHGLRRCLRLGRWRSVFASSRLGVTSLHTLRLVAPHSAGSAPLVAHLPTFINWESQLTHPAAQAQLTGRQIAALALSASGLVIRSRVSPRPFAKRRGPILRMTPRVTLDLSPAPYSGLKRSFSGP